MRGGGGEYQDFPSKITCLTVPKLSGGESFAIALISGIKKVWIRKGVVSRFSIEIYLSHSAEKFRRGTLWCFADFMHKKGLSLNSV